MKCPPASPVEAERLAAFSEYELSSGSSLPSLDPVVRIAARMFDMPIAAVNMIGNDHVFFVAETGLDGASVDMGRNVSFCAHAILQDEVMVVPDATLDARFNDNPLVTGSTHVRLYAGVTILSAQGYPLGALCVIDTEPNPDFSDDDAQRLRELARMATDRLELRRIELSSERIPPPAGDPEWRSPTAMIRFDSRGVILDWNESAAALYGYEVAEGPGLPMEELTPERGRKAQRELIARAVATGSIEGLRVPPEVRGVRRDGTEFLLGFSLFCWREEGRLIFNAHFQDLSALRHEKDLLRRMANTDVLTGAANRTHFYRHTQAALTGAHPAAVIMIDLDGFKDINDTLGHAAGDIVLGEVALRLKALVRPEDTVARVGADEFALLLPGVTDAEAARRVAQAAARAVSQPVVADGLDVMHVTACCGVALAPQHAQEAVELIGDADMALVKAKQSGRGQIFMFTIALRMEVVTRRLYSMELQRAVNDGEFVLFYQPQLDLGTNTLIGAEALIRWRHPRRGLLSPATFLPSLECGPLAQTVGGWILEEACAQAALWRRSGAPEFQMGVNLFGAQFRVGQIDQAIQAVLSRHGLPPQALELEVTENIVLDDDVVLDSLQRLRDIGLGIAFDDFGTGYASLSLLKRYPLTRIKIDRSFVMGMVQSDRDASVVRAIIDMARSFDLQTIAEGVETAEQLDKLRRLGCSQGQGYLFGKPMPAWEFSQAFGLDASWLRQKRA
ncbi:MAG: putative bifunctional diguanylate cyclase/phosphodiesterase [Bordetella sp.]|uniref:putative bifunctional diguanylate cyclase/phosphodiesterase n=1 Tax=Bordetella sp. TaxID=28081 RepID=UPI003F7B50CB